MTRLLAIAEIRLREGLAARLVWLVPLAFAVGVGAALWAEGPDPAARAALADRVALWAAWGLAFVVAAIVPALGMPADVRTGAAQTLLASPVSRFEVVLGGVLGYGALSTLLLVAMAGAANLGMQVAGVGAAEREPIRTTVAAEPVGANAAGDVVVDSASPVAAFRFRVPAGLRPGEPLVVRLAPKRRVETSWNSETVVIVAAGRPGGAESVPDRVEFKAGTAFTAHVPLGDLWAGDDAELTVRRSSGGWALDFTPGSVEIGGARRLYALGLVEASLCAVPMLLILAAIGSLGAARFGAPTAAALAAFLFLVFVGRGFFLDAARYIEAAAADPTLAQNQEEEHGHEHGAVEPISPARLALAKAAIAALEILPRYETFDRTDSLIERRAPTWGDLGRAAAEGLPAAAAVTALAWMLFRRREFAPG
jgi:hypothetical protein